MPAEVIDQAWPQPPDDPMWSVFTRDTTPAASVARVGTAWLMLVGMGARLWPMSPLQARFDTTLRTTVGTLDYWKKYVDPVVYASMLGCLVVVYECMWLSVQQDSDSDRLLPAVPWPRRPPRADRWPSMTPQGWRPRPTLHVARIYRRCAGSQYGLRAPSTCSMRWSQPIRATCRAPGPSQHRRRDNIRLC
ncbi:hypothetical protein pclt_cds_734c [Pandoravirus celtis]|uniref:Uncharacterized protein n=1 Tax=Pandoravirus celtis TaxID=2568002 RepID=A0A4D6EIR6_9VIRU|nr:hypothetical protein pclt_cds_734c [Pandoravirus celtis]